MIIFWAFVLKFVQWFMWYFAKRALSLCLCLQQWVRKKKANTCLAAGRAKLQRVINTALRTVHCALSSLEDISISQCLRMVRKMTSDPSHNVYTSFCHQTNGSAVSLSVCLRSFYCSTLLRYLVLSLKTTLTRFHWVFPLAAGTWLSWLRHNSLIWVPVFQLNELQH